MKESLGNRMKHNYEQAFNFRLPSRMPIIMRLDGKCFHTFTRGMDKPFDKKLVANMTLVAKKLCENIEGAQLAYTQSDEISILIHNYKKFDTQGWFDNEIQKMCSTSAAIASAYMSSLYKKLVLFDSRVFVLPENEVNNYFIWREQDATRNSISMLAQSLYSHKELHSKNSKAILAMIMAKASSWNDLPLQLQRGSCIIKDEFGQKWVVDKKIPLFTNDHNYIDKLLIMEEE